MQPYIPGNTFRAKNIKLGNGYRLVLPVINRSGSGTHSRSYIQTGRHKNIETTYHQI